MNNQVILVILDGLNYQVACQCMGYLQGLVARQRACLYSVTCELPAMSRPLYECLLTGVAPVDSGIVNNQIVRRSQQDSVFSLARQQGKVTAAAAYHWFSELYNQAPYQAQQQRMTDDIKLNIQHAIFYHWDHYPDEAVFLDAEYLRQRYNPDFLLIHSMNIDDTGHKSGLDSSQYRNCARMADNLLSGFIDNWLSQGYQIMITSDHGMNNDHSHCGILPEERTVPLFLLGDKFTLQATTAPVIPQTTIFGLICQLLQLEHQKPFPPEVLTV